MCDAGRVRKHLKRLLWTRKATVLLAGYQAIGTLGRFLSEGAERVRIQGDDIQVRARIRSLDVYSGHADARGLVAWVQARGPVRAEVFLAHGEPPALAGLKDRLAAAGTPADRMLIPAIDQSFDLTGGRARAGEGARRIAPEAPGQLDWHNARAALLIDLDRRLERLDDAARMALLRRLARKVDEA
jgi:metallo-beta-lactamase family protein